jgi:hypothetical protein
VCLFGGVTIKDPQMTLDVDIYRMTAAARTALSVEIGHKDA